MRQIWSIGGLFRLRAAHMRRRPFQTGSSRRRPARVTHLALLAACVVAGVGVAASAATGGFSDPLQVAARMSPLANSGLLLAVARAGERLVAVGQRGHIVVSADGGASWQQSRVPVSSDLTAVFFVDAAKGWAVGHDGVILHSSNGGESWELQLDGLRANELLVAAMERKYGAAAASEEGQRLLAEAHRYKEQGADKPFLDLWFADGSTGYAVGAYNLIFRTDDGGKTWEPWFDRTENPKLFNLYSVRPGPGGLYVAGEGGLLMRLDASGEKFRALQTPYNGSFFGIVGTTDAALLAFGLRGNVYRSEDEGRSWAKVETGLPATVVAGTSDAAGTVYLADLGGRVMASADGGRSFSTLPTERTMPLAGIADAGGGRIALVGPRGVAVTAAKR